MTIDSHYRFYQGPWINGTSAAFLIIAWQRDVRPQITLMETYILVPRSGLLSDSFGPTILQSGIDAESLISTIQVIAKNRIQWNLSRRIPAQAREQFRDLFPYTLTEISRDKLTSELMTYYQNAGEKIRSDLSNIEVQSPCEDLRNCLKILREMFKVET